VDDHRSEHEQPASAGCSKPPPILLAGEPGWVSGPCYGPGEPSAIPELTLADLAAAIGHRGWVLTDHGGLTILHEFPSPDGRYLTVVCSR
jgi:hypothetical protein